MGLLVFFQLALAYVNLLEDHVCTDLPVIRHVLALALYVAIVGCQACTLKFCCWLPTSAAVPVLPILRLVFHPGGLAPLCSLPSCLPFGEYVFILK